jgi:hypothetical protein
MQPAPSVPGAQKLQRLEEQLGVRPVSGLQRSPNAAQFKGSNRRPFSQLSNAPLAQML